MLNLYWKVFIMDRSRTHYIHQLIAAVIRIFSFFWIPFMSRFSKMKTRTTRDENVYHGSKGSSPFNHAMLYNLHFSQVALDFRKHPFVGYCGIDATPTAGLGPGKCILEPIPACKRAHSYSGLPPLWSVWRFDPI